MRIAFYAPLKAPDHPVPSGDRTIARLLFAALAHAGETRGWGVEVASRFRSFDGAGDAERQARLRDLGARVAARLVESCRRGPADRRPRLWFTYHLYHKAPDWLGPTVSERLGIPYVVAEASYAAKQAAGPWRTGHEAAAHGIRRADAILALNRDDVPGVRAVASRHARIQLLPPFLGREHTLSDEERADSIGAPPVATSNATPGDKPSIACKTFAGDRRRRDAREGPVGRWGLPPDEPWLLCVAMMRHGRKLASFAVLADALADPVLAGMRWHLVVAGGGPAHDDVEKTIGRRLARGRVTLTGRVEGEDLAGLYTSSDLFLWPAVGEPMGMAMLEAQAYGLPVVAARTRGVPDLVSDEETGLLVPEGDAEAFAGAVRTLLGAPDRLRAMGRAARRRVSREHGFEAASDRIGALLEALVRRSAHSPRYPPAPPPNPMPETGCPPERTRTASG